MALELLIVCFKHTWWGSNLPCKCSLCYSPVLEEPHEQLKLAYMLSSYSNNGQPMETGRRMDKMKIFAGEEPAVERTWNSGYKTWFSSCSHCFLKIFSELVQGFENGVEIIPRQIIQKHLNFRQLTVYFLAHLVHCSDNFQDRKKSFGSRRTTQVYDA